MQNNIEKAYSYISGDGSLKDIRTLNTEYLINAVGKCYRQIYNSGNDESTINKYLSNITNIETELRNRVMMFLDKRKGV